MFDYWQVQSEKLLFPEIEWSKPEQKSQAGKILIVGGSAGVFRAVDASYTATLRTGAGRAKALIPDALTKVIKAPASDIIFAPSNFSGGFSQDSYDIFKSGNAWADSTILIGDFSKNSETAILIEKFVLDSEKPLLITRDAIDLILASAQEILEKDNVTIVASFAQLQKIFSSVFYPKVLTFSMQLNNLVEALHKFTLTFPATIIVIRNEQIIIARAGKVFSSKNINPMQIWSGEMPTKIAIWQMWNPTKPAEAAITAIQA